MIYFVQKWGITMEERTSYDILIDEIEKEEKAYAEKLKTRRETRENRVQNLKLKKRNLRKVIAKTSIGTGILALVAIGGCKLFEDKPIQVVATELISDANLNETDNGKTIYGKMTEQELLDYIEEHGLSLDEIKEETISGLKIRRIDSEFGMEEVERANPAVFETESKGKSK